MSSNLVLRGGRVIDPSQGIDKLADVVITDGRVAGLDVAPPAGAETVDATGAIVTPGLIDLHTHVYWGGTSLGVDPDAYALKSASPLLVDAGSAGPGNYAGFSRHVIGPAFPRILSFLHISFAGIYAFSDTVKVGESHDMRLMAARDSVRVVAENPDTIVGIKVRIGANASGPSGIAPMDVAMAVAEETRLPLMVHIDEPPPSYGEVVARLRKGDVLTHCFRPFPNAPVDGEGNVRPQVREARERGVIFDIAHGMGSFSWKSARAMLAQDFRPDVISSDVHAFCLDGPAHDNLHVMTKFMALGWTLPEVIEAASAAPARVLGLQDRGHLRPGALGDVSVFREAEGPVDLVDVRGEVVPFDRRLTPVGIAVGGEWRAA
ncbi:amidohydrolase/deacetylase family metallohydrolase [Frigidibacter sp. ROC022]|uniref:amidohydrolase/deacetylase family metallohydrolase n=1 Tax=Frigidibacter sp. ROC022 TaxID=2971796 RepID=UPI00215AD0CB|nr:amidohydrolase/deacetylase family metallohydrolase [Frigidibacter sp. ROC022]MCR8722724.1 amidohydrolase/deacetylase family metallohydrolase [Frigidibacter sp. ROC022]